MNPCRSGDHGVLQQVRLLVIHNSAPFPKAWRIHREHLIRRGQPIDPTFKFACFPRILPPCPLHPSLYLTQRHGGKEQVRFFHGSKPCGHRSVWAHFSQFRHDVSVEQISVHSNSTTGRLRNFPRFGITMSKRGSGASNHSLRLGGAAFCSLSHSSIGTRTAVLTPRRVTICGPFLMVAFRNSLNRAFASCTCHEAKLDLLLTPSILLTSQVSSQHTFAGGE